MAELSNMLQLDENKNASTVDNHVSESNMFLISPTNNGVKNTTPDYTVQSCVANKGNFSEVNCNITVESLETLNFSLSAESESLVKLETTPLPESSAGSILGDSLSSYKTSNGSPLGETGNSFNISNGRFLETVKSPNSSVQNLLNDTISKVEEFSPRCRPNLTMPGTEFNAEGDISPNNVSFNLSGKYVSFTEDKNSSCNLLKDCSLPDQEVKDDSSRTLNNSAPNEIYTKSCSLTSENSESTLQLAQCKETSFNIDMYTDPEVKDDSFKALNDSAPIEIYTKNCSLTSENSESNFNFAQCKETSFNIDMHPDPEVKDNSSKALNNSAPIEIYTKNCSLISDNSESTFNLAQYKETSSNINICDLPKPLIDCTSTIHHELPAEDIPFQVSCSKIDSPIPADCINQNDSGCSVIFKNELPSKEFPFKVPYAKTDSNSADCINQNGSECPTVVKDKLTNEEFPFKVPCAKTDSNSADCINQNSSGCSTVIKDELTEEEFSFKVPYVKTDPPNSDDCTNLNGPGCSSTMVKNKLPSEELPCKVPHDETGSPSSGYYNNQNHSAFQNSPQFFDETAMPTKYSEELDHPLSDLPECKVSDCTKNSSGIQELPPFDLMGMDFEMNPNDNFVFKVPENPTDADCEEFTDAVQFFKDPSSFQFLENIKTSHTEANVPRSSLYIKFDPLHALSSQRIADNYDIHQGLKTENNVEASKQCLDVSTRESLGNILISFDSPRVPDCREAKTPVSSAPSKLYTEEELQQILKVNELTSQEMLLKKQREMEEDLVKKEQEMMKKADEKDIKISTLENILKIQCKVLEELTQISSIVTEKNKEMLQKTEATEEENEKWKGEVKTLTEDLQSVETTFADFHKRYEQCKGMLKTYKENEILLRAKLQEQERMYEELQERTREASEKANSEISSVKKGSEAQIAVLKAQLKKAELKISSLESDIKQIKIENCQLGGICDDLMEKVGKS